MGGNAFENTRRLSEAEYIATVERILAALQLVGSVRRAAVPPALQDKDSHGDIDVLVLTDDDDDLAETMDSLVDALQAIESKCWKKYSMLHILIKDRVQIDLIFVPDATLFDLAVASRSHGRFVHLLNMALKKQALALTEHGLQLSYTKENRHVLCTDLTQIGDFFGFPPSVFDGKTRLTTEQIVDLVFQCRFFDVRQFWQLESRQDLLRSPVFATLLSRIKALDKDEYRSLSRNVEGQNKAGRIAAKAFGVDFDRIKNVYSAKVEVKRWLHGGFFVSLVPMLRQHKDVLNRMPEILLDSVAQGDWMKLQEWHGTTSQEEKKTVLEAIVAQETSDQNDND